MKEFFETLFSPKKALTSKSWRWQYYGAITDAKWFLAILNILVHYCPLKSINNSLKHA